MSTASVTTAARPSVTAWRNAVFAVFAVNGFAMAAWISRIPAIRDHLHLGLQNVGLLLAAVSIGAITGLLLSGQIVHLLGGRRSILITLIGEAVGIVIAGFGSTVTDNFAVVFVGLLIFGVNTSICDVAMNVEGAGVEHARGKTIMPLFHALWSAGTVTGAGLGALAAFLNVSTLVHLGVIAVVVVIAAPVIVRYIPRADAAAAASGAASGEPEPTLRERLSVWLEPRTLLIGVIMLGMAFAEGASNDWLAIGMIDDRGLDQGGGALVYAVFVTAMTLGRVFGGPVVDRIGRIPALRGAAALAFIGLAIVIFVPIVWVNIVGVVLWGVGASLGFPIGMSAAADDPRKAAARVSAVATVAYTAFLVGPPVIGFISHLAGVGTLHALILVLALIALSLLAVPAARESGVRTRSADAVGGAGGTGGASESAGSADAAVRAEESSH